MHLLSAKGSFPRNPKILAEVKLTPRCKDFVRHFGTFQFCDAVTKLVLRFVNCRRQNFHFQCVGKVDTTNARHCEKVFVIVRLCVCWGISSNFSEYVKYFFAWKISQTILQISTNFLKNQGPRERAEFKEIKSKLDWQSMWCIILDRTLKHNTKLFLIMNALQSRQVSSISSGPENEQCICEEIKK